MSERTGLSRPMILAIVALNLIVAVYSVIAADVGRSPASSIVTNMYLILAWVALVGVLSYLEAVLIRDMLGRGGWRGQQEIVDPRQRQSRPWRELHLPLTLSITVLLGLNLLIFDSFAGGFFVVGQQVTHTVTRLRSEDQQLQREGIISATRMSDPRIRRALTELLVHPGPNRATAAWALGRLGASAASEELLELLQTGDVDERAAAAVALGRLHHEALTAELIPRLLDADEPLESYLYALGLLGEGEATPAIVQLMLSPTTAPDHLALGAWALGQLDDPRGCPVLLEAVAPSANPLTCAATHAIAKLRCPRAAETLIQTFETAELEDRCDRQRFIDHNGRPIEIWSANLFRVELLEALLRVPHREHQGWLRRVANDGRQVPQVRVLARQNLEVLTPLGASLGSAPPEGTSSP